MLMRMAAAATPSLPPPGTPPLISFARPGGRASGVKWWSCSCWCSALQRASPLPPTLCAVAEGKAHEVLGASPVKKTESGMAADAGVFRHVFAELDVAAVEAEVADIGGEE